MTVRFSIRAQSDLDDIFAYIAQDSETFAHRTVAQLIEVTEYLARFPGIGRQIPDSVDPNMRERFHKRYRVAYNIEGDLIEILTIHHTAKITD